MTRLQRSVPDGWACGFLGDPKRACTCALIHVQRYRSKRSRPILDLMDMQPCTIADLEASPQIKSPHLAEAVQYRSLDRRVIK